MNRIHFFILLLGIGLFSCKKFVTVDAPTISLADKTVFSDSATAEAAVLGLYYQCMQSNLSFFNGAGTLFSGLSSDELEITSTNPNYRDIYYYSIPATNVLMGSTWTEFYQLIYRANAAIEGLAAHGNDGRPVFRRLKGEAHFMRALAYFELLHHFGPVPLAITTNYTVNATLRRATETEVLNQVVADLQQANQLLPSSYYARNGRVRPNRFAAQALLSRVFLYRKEWDGVINAADQVLAETNLYQLADRPSLVFDVTSKEAIWQLMPVIPGYNTGTSQLFLIGSGMPTYATLQPSFIASFEEGDLRLDDWIAKHNFSGRDYFQPKKYQYRSSAEGKEFIVMLRLGEVVLNRAEAKAELGDLEGAIDDLNQIRERAGLPNVLPVSKPALLAAIYQERRIELGFENTHRWFDLKRSGQADATLAALKPESWKTTAALWPIPQSEINANPNINQNPGY